MKKKKPDEAYMDAKAPMNSRTINAKEDPKGNGRPSGVLRITIETDLKKKQKQKEVIL